jgi:hypothetical protein
MLASLDHSLTDSNHHFLPYKTTNLMRNLPESIAFVHSAAESSIARRRLVLIYVENERE